MRKQIYEEKTQPQKVWVGEEASCDLCGFDEDETLIFEVKVAVGEDDCVSTVITRDVCDRCYWDKLDPLLNPVFEALKAEDGQLQEAHEDSWNG